MHPKPVINKAQYSEAEAAQELGISVEDLRSLIRTYIASEDVEEASVPMATFQPSDLLVLRILTKNNLSSVA